MIDQEPIRFNGSIVGANLKKLRTERHLTQGAVVELVGDQTTRAGVSRNWIANIETGRTKKVSRERVLMFASAFQVESSILTTGSEAQNQVQIQQPDNLGDFRVLVHELNKVLDGTKLHEPFGSLAREAMQQLLECSISDSNYVGWRNDTWPPPFYRIRSMGIGCYPNNEAVRVVTRPISPIIRGTNITTFLYDLNIRWKNRSNGMEHTYIFDEVEEVSPQFLGYLLEEQSRGVIIRMGLKSDMFSGFGGNFIIVGERYVAYRGFVGETRFDARPDIVRNAIIDFDIISRLSEDFETFLKRI